MILDILGRKLTTNTVTFDGDSVIKTYRSLPLSLFWGFLERKPLQSADERYNRDLDLMRVLHDGQLNVPQVLVSCDETRTITMKREELTDFLAIFDDQEEHVDDKLQLFKEALQLLHAIHQLGEHHGDPYFKNFFRMETPSQRPSARVFTCDFEWQRSFPDPAAYDVALFAANGINALRKQHPKSEGEVYEAVREVYGKLHIPLDTRDRFFYRMRFRMNDNFFAYFAKPTVYLLPNS